LPEKVIRNSRKISTCEMIAKKPMRNKANMSRFEIIGFNVASSLQYSLIHRHN
jgi:hypothetical protein